MKSQPTNPIDVNEPGVWTFWLFVTIALVLTAVPVDAMAQTSGGISIPFITEFGCKVVQFLRGPLAILILILVCVATLVIGMISKMDWSRLLFTCVIFGVIATFGPIMASSSYVTSAAGLSACLQ